MAMQEASQPVTLWPLANQAQVEWPPMRCTPSLQAPQGPLVDFLSSGYGYDDQSVGQAVLLANQHFGRRELGRAIDYYGAAYEIGRLHFDYKPLMHDCVLRRVMCYSMQGDLQQAHREVDLALRVIPHSAPALLYRGLLHTKMGEADEANQAFQEAVSLCRELRDLVDCIVAFHLVTQGLNDRAIQTCSQVLLRRPDHVMAKIVRGDAYKFHASGYFAKQAAEDYTAILDRNPDLQPLIGEMYTPQQHARYDELLLRFHPRLAQEGPRPYGDYPMCASYRVRRPFLVAAFVLFASAKLKTAVRSMILVKNVEQRNKELFEARCAAEKKVRQLVQTQQRLASVESSSYSEVWGPADPEHIHVRKYRRYWMERPLGFPRRGDSPREDDGECGYEDGSQVRTGDWDEATLGTLSPSMSGSPAVPSPGVHGAPRWAPSWPSAGTGSSWTGAAASDPDGARLASSRAASPARGASPAHGASPGGAPSPPLGASPGAAPSPPSASAPGSPLPPGEAPVLLFKSGAQAAAGGAEGPRSPGPEVPATVDLLLDSTEPNAPPHPDAKKRSMERVYPPRPVPNKLGHDWNDTQWLAKAYELVDAFTASAPGADTTAAAVAAAARHAAGAAPSSPRSPRRSAPESSVRMLLPDGEAVSMAQAIEKQGLHVIPDWFTSVDRLYEVSDMTCFSTEPEGLAASSGLAGAPGYSYVINKNSGSGSFSGHRGHFLGTGGGGPLRADHDAGFLSSEALLRRYQNKLLQTTLPGIVGATR